MMQKLEKLVRLQALTKMLADQALHPVELAGRHRRKIQARVDEVARHHEQLMRSETADLALAATLASQAERLRKQKAEKMVELAAAHARLKAEQEKASRAVGRDLVLKALVEKLDAEQAREMLRKRLR